MKPNVTPVMNTIEKVTKDGIITGDGVEHKIDVLVCATGFNVVSSNEPEPYGEAQVITNVVL